MRLLAKLAQFLIFFYVINRTLFCTYRNNSAMCLPDDMVLVADSVAAQHVPTLPGYLQGLHTTKYF